VVQATPLQAEMEFDYANDPARREHVWGGGYVTAVDGAYYAAATGSGSGRIDCQLSRRSDLSGPGLLGSWA
jgi:hypothetical protein